ncbi:MAG: hypothetical protein IIV40_02300, partial [Oscillospiraceae bacterium]|nr:hypothetical protein [Oscillospiraceae bacterium]
PKIAAGIIPEHVAGIFKNFAAGFKNSAKKSAALLLQIKTESAMNGKSAGITEKEQRLSPFRIPSLSSAPLKRRITQSAVAQSAVRKFFPVKKASTLFRKFGTIPALM